MIDEEILVRQLQNNQTKEKAFRILIHEYKKRLLCHIRKIAVSHDDADDILQNTFIKVFKGINRFNRKSKLYSWLYRIATNESITFINKRAQLGNVCISEINQEPVACLQSDEWLTGNEIQLLLQEAVSTLPEKQQLVFNLKYFDQMKYNEISELLKTSIGGLKASYYHAVKKIKHHVITKKSLVKT